MMSHNMSKSCEILPCSLNFMTHSLPRYFSFSFENIGYGIGIHLHKIRDVGSRDPKLPTPGSTLFNLAKLIRTAAALFFGVLMDRKGNFITRLIAYVLLLTGLVLMAFIESDELLLWGAWPMLSIVWYFKYCPATVDCHETKVKNAGNQVLFGNQLLLLGNQLYTQEYSDFSRVHYFKILIKSYYNSLPCK